MKYHFLFFVLAVSATVSCSQTAIEESPAPEGTAQTGTEEAFTSEIEIKLSEELAEEVGEDLTGGCLQTKSAKFNDMVERLGIKSVSKIFTEDERYAERQHRAGLHLWYRITVDPSAAPVTRAASEMLDMPGILEAYPVRRVKRMDFNDPRFSSQWGLYQASGIDINVSQVWETYTCGSENVIVNVVDGGVTQHEDFSVIPAGQGGSRNFVNNSYSMTPDDHGFHVTGIIAATNNNSIGICGVAGGDAERGIPAVRILSSQVFSGDASGNFADAIRYGADNGAVISQNSWGNYYDMNEDGVVSGSELDVAMNDQVSGAIKAAIDYFIDYAGCDNDGNQLPESPMKGGVVFFASGNENIPYGVPASYERVIAVGAVDRNGQRSSFSNYGDWVDICAPGSNIMSTVIDGYASMDGTSMACPFVSGVAALLVSHFGGPGFTNEMLKDRILNGADNTAITNQSRHIGPLLDALGAFTYGGTTPPDRVESFNATGGSGRIDFSWTVTADQDNVKAYGYLLLASRDAGLLEDINPGNIPDGVISTTVTVDDREAGEQLTGSMTGLEFSADYNVCIIGYDYQHNYSEPSDILQVTTTANGTPVIVPSETGILEIKPFETVTRKFTISDPDGHSFTVDFTPGSAAASLAAGTSAGEYILTITGRLADTGSYSAEITVSDSYGATAHESVEYRISENNAPQVISEAEDIMMTAVREEMSIDLTGLISDPDGENLSWSITNTNPATIHATISTNTLYLTALGFGNADIAVTGTDARGEKCQISFSVVVKNPDQPLEVYPNPVSDYLNIRTMDEASTRIVIFSSTGSVKYDTTSRVGAFSPAVIDMRGYAPGRYTVRVSFGGNEYTRTVVKL